MIYIYIQYRYKAKHESCYKLEQFHILTYMSSLYNVM